jgi:hypothetical protein
MGGKRQLLTPSVVEAKPPYKAKLSYTFVFVPSWDELPRLSVPPVSYSDCEWIPGAALLLALPPDLSSVISHPVLPPVILSGVEGPHDCRLREGRDKAFSP